MVTEKMIEAARDKFKELAGIQIYSPGEGTLDDFEQGRYDALVAALEAALSTEAEPVWQFTKGCKPAKVGWTIETVYDGAQPPSQSVSAKTWTQKDAERENAAFDEWFKARRYPDYPDLYPLTTENAMHAAWQEAAKRSALSAKVQDVALPEGWQLVPREPTQEMELRGCRSSENTPDEVRPSTASVIYRAMLAAAPAAKQGEAE